MSVTATSSGAAVERVAPMDLRDWLWERKQPFITSGTLAEMFACEPARVSRLLRAAREAGMVENVTQGGWVPIVNGYPPHPVEFIDQWMNHLGHDYYISFTSGADLQGFAHQRYPVVSVVTDARLRKRVMNHTTLRFASTSGFGKHLVERKRVGHYRFQDHPIVNCATKETVLLDMAQRPLYGSGAYYWYLATIAGEMMHPALNRRYSIDRREEERLNPNKLAETALLYPTPVRQRLGFVLEWMREHHGLPDDVFDLEPLAATIPTKARRVDLAALPPVGDFYPEAKYSPRWKLYYCCDLDPDF